MQVPGARSMLALRRSAAGGGPEGFADSLAACLAVVTA